MATQQEWEDYFELLNGRQPNIAEIQAALQVGAFKPDQAAQASQTAQVPPVQVQSQAPVQNSESTMTRAQLFQTPEEAQAEVHQPTQPQQPVQSEAPAQWQQPVQAQPAAQSQAPVQVQQPVQQVQPSQSAYQQGQFASQASQQAFAQPVQPQQAAVPVKPRMENFFSWFVKRALHPSQYVHEENPNALYLWISYGLATLLSAGVVWNLARRIIYGLINSFGDDLVPYQSKSAVRMVANSALTPVFFVTLITFAVFFLSNLAGLSFISRSKYTFRQTLYKYLAWFPTTAFLAALGFLYSFIAPVYNFGSLASIDSERDPSAAMHALTVINLEFIGYAILPVLAVSVVYYGTYYLVQDARFFDAKVDMIWWQFIQVLVTWIVLYLAVKFIVVPFGISQIITMVTHLAGQIG
ncbi:hypothetical protein [Eupransor demetentiae]|uniref:Membrane protein TolA involved in colicin uptake (TolA) n=1 Tax=Eupransor demetentiae TaxID=3109584 RepID=A0ABP0ESF1_9LACO|nr:Membrane protein TolA involved in colicin uptake (TolA) [Lactobacillaceae bacterium LMG 33000]